MSRNCLQFLMGLNGASVVRGLRFGFAEFASSCIASLVAVHPRQSQTDYRLLKELKSIPEITLDEILGTRKVEIKLCVQQYEGGRLPDNEAMVLLSILAAENPREVLEIGTFMGHTTR